MMMDGRLDFAPAGYLSFHDNGIITSVNETLASWLGYSKDTLKGKNVETIFTLATRIFYNTHFLPLVKLHGTGNEIFITLSGRENNDIPVLTNAVRKQEADHFEIQCIFMPVRERRKYEDELLNAKRVAEKALLENKHLEELKTSFEVQTLELDKQYRRLLTINHDLLQFSKIISHDLQEPLRKIRIFSEMVMNEDGDKLSKRSLAAMEKINNAAERLKSLTFGLQQYITVDEEKTYSEVDLNVIVQAAKTKAVAKRNFDDFDFIAEKLPVIQGYRTQLELLFFNLIDNAIQFRDSRRLLIRISGVLLDENVYHLAKDKYRFSEHLRILFSDNGIGFSNTYKDYVFVLLKKLNPITEGLGIGLSLIKKIVDNHSGSMSVESEEGKGTSVTITLPVKFS